MQYNSTKSSNLYFKSSLRLKLQFCQDQGTDLEKACKHRACFNVAVRSSGNIINKHSKTIPDYDKTGLKELSDSGRVCTK